MLNRCIFSLVGLLLALCIGVSAQTGAWSFNDIKVTKSPTPVQQIVFCFEECKGQASSAACACGRDFTSRCAAKCAGYDDTEIVDSTCHEQHCRNANNNGASPCDTYSKCTALQQYLSYNGTCVGSTYSCVQTSLLLTCPMHMQNDGKGVCLLAGGERYTMPNQCFAQSLGLASRETPCKPYVEDGETKEPIFFYNKDALQYYYDFSNSTLMAEFGDIIIEDTCGCNYDYNPVHVRFPEFCLSFWNDCLRTCKKKKYESRQDTYWQDSNLIYGTGLCVDPCNEKNGAPYPCSAEDNCYPIRNSARCFPNFAKQSECGKSCPDYESTETPKNPVCVRVYAGVLVDNVYRGGGTVSAYTYKNSCLAQCEGFVPGDWEAGNCNDLAVSKCEQKCGNIGGSPVCATVKVPVQLDTSSDQSSDASGNTATDNDDGDLIAISYVDQKQTVASACLAECLGWTNFVQGSCEAQVVDISGSWFGFKQQRCEDYAQDAGNGQNYLKYCDDKCNDETCPPEAFGKSGCQACKQCEGSPKCAAASDLSTGWYGYQGKTPCSSYAASANPSYYNYCDDKHQGTDPAFKDKTACEACSECAGSSACSGGFRGQGGIKCETYNIQAPMLTCHTDIHTGSDPVFNGKNACQGCPQQCSKNLICSRTSGFVGSPVYGCEGYTGPNSDYCNDVHLGLDPTYKNQNACQACPICANSRPCRASATGFVGYDYMTCSEGYAPGKSNHFFCPDDKHLGQDKSYAGKTACEGCPNECGSFWKCNIPATGFVGYKGATCAQYDKNAKDSLYVHCAEDKHDGKDPQFIGKTACDGCSQCSDMPACNAPKTGFVGYKKIDLCKDYAGEKQKWCRDEHTGEDPLFKGKDACEACPECAGASVCRDVFEGLEGECSAYANQQKRCADKHIGPSKKFNGQYACDACSECQGAPVCQPAFSFNGSPCSKYANGPGSYYKYCNDKHNSEYPASAAFVGKTACEGCSAECTGSPAC